VSTHVRTHNRSVFLYIFLYSLQHYRKMQHCCSDTQLYCRAMLRAADRPRRRYKANKESDYALLSDSWCADPIRAASVPAPRGAA
jgi:hypothetical protein